MSEPTAVVENNRVNVPVPPWNVLTTNSESTTWKLKASVPTTAIITSRSTPTAARTSRSTG